MPFPLLWGTAAVGMGALFPVGLAWVFTHPPRTRHLRNPRCLGIFYERIRLRTEDGLRLSAWYIPAPGGVPRGVVVVCHGYFGNRSHMLPHLRFLHDAGYAVLLFDFRAHGWSGGNLVTLGCAEQHDLRAALAWVRARPDLEDVPCILLGESMGASVALLVAAGDPHVRAVVADSAFARLDSAVAGRLRSAFGPAGVWLTPRTRRIGERLIGARCVDVAPVEAIAALGDRPVLLIHGARDQLIAPENARLLLAAAPNHTALWEIPGARHVRGIYVAPDDYARRVLAFLDDALSSGTESCIERSLARAGFPPAGGEQQGAMNKEPSAPPSLDPAFVELLACPACDDRPPLRLAERDGRLHCDRCGRAYPISPEGIPLLLVEKAETTAPTAS